MKQRKLNFKTKKRPTVPVGLIKKLTFNPPAFVNNNNDSSTDIPYMNSNVGITNKRAISLELTEPEVKKCKLTEKFIPDLVLNHCELSTDMSQLNTTNFTTPKLNHKIETILSGNFSFGGIDEMELEMLKIYDQISPLNKKQLLTEPNEIPDSSLNIRAVDNELNATGNILALNTPSDKYHLNQNTSLEEVGEFDSSETSSLLLFDNEDHYDSSFSQVFDTAIDDSVIKDDLSILITKSRSDSNKESEDLNIKNFLPVNKTLSCCVPSVMMDSREMTQLSADLRNINNNEISDLLDSLPVQNNNDDVVDNNLCESMILNEKINEKLTILQMEREEEEDLLKLSRKEFNLPKNVIAKYNAVGINSLYEWQVDCLLTNGVLQGKKNLIYGAPTSAGKTMVCELLVLKKVIETKQKAIIILPFVSIVSEKTKYLQTMFESENLRICGYYGNNGNAKFDEIDIAVCTIEKANSLLNKLMETGKTNTLGIVVVDELHMIGDQSRGYLLELLLTKLKFVLRETIQIIGMSATLPNIEILARWLKAELYLTHYRPIPLKEYIKVGNTIFDVENNDNTRTFEKVAKLISSLLTLPVSDEIKYARKELLNELSRTPGENDKELFNTNYFILLKGGLDPVLEFTLGCGVAYHHSGLTVEERELIEDGFRGGYIHTLAATSTLASGVNLPARRVIFRSPMIGRQFLDITSYKQMKGRAGRKGKDVAGESILMCSELEAKKVHELVNSDLQPVRSCLTSDQKGMKRALLEVIVNGIVSTSLDVKQYIESTLLFSQQGSHDAVVTATVNSATEFLVKGEFINVEIICKPDENIFSPKKTKSSNLIQKPGSLQKFSPTKLGYAAVSSALSPEESLIVFEELKKALRNFVLEDELHIIYQVTPTFLNLVPNWNLYLRVFNHLNEVQRNIAETVGISEWFLIKASIQKCAVQNSSSLSIHKRFWASMMLNDLVQENEFKYVMNKYGVDRGTLQQLQSVAATFSGMVTIFCEKLGWSNLELLLLQFKERLNFGVQKELIELVRIPFVKGTRARILWKAGFHSVASIACAAPEEIFEHLKKHHPFKSSKGSQMDVDSSNRIEFRAACSIVNSAKQLLESDRKVLERAAKNLMEPNSAILNSARKVISASKIKSGSYANWTSNSTTQQAIKSNVEHAKKKNLYLKTPSSNAQNLITYGDNFQIIYVKVGNNAFDDICKEWEMIEEYCWNIAWTKDNSSDFDVQNLSKVDFNRIASIFKKESVKICFDAKFQVKLLFNAGFDHVSFTLVDPCVAAWCINPDQQEKSLQQMMKIFLPQSTYTMPSNNVEKCCRENVQTLKLMHYLQGKLRSKSLLRHFFEVEMPLIQVLASMELVGLGMLENLENVAHTLAGKFFSLASPVQVAQVLFDDLQLPYPLVCKANSKLKRKTNKEVLEKLQNLHPIITVLMQHRTISTLVSNHLLPLISLNGYHNDVEMPRIHCNFDYQTSTGRIVTSNPNLQNIPHPKHLPQSNESLTIETINIRECFEATNGSCLLSVDYCQIELRLIAYLAQEKILLRSFEIGEDPFKIIASEWFNIPIEMVTTSIRKRTKNVTYAVLYGVGAKSLSEELDLSVREAEDFIQDFRKKFAAIPKFQKEVIRKCSERGYVETITGRKRFLPLIHSQSFPQRSHAERQALNTIVQGSAADLVKISMVAIYKEFQKRFGSSKPGIKLIPHLLLQIHDELIFEIPNNLLEEMKLLIDKTMTVHEYNVPLKVKMRSGTTWGSLQ
ncbi:hypothetical protein HK099_002624 [Clydaea vesicula]|uniref:DNA-directed DNA polymerase n=1 Tax=Clydaea vesicula TaxID=447962 RepID=A0AAD5U2B2_9FUNG|nr:hypothetical protein HK099_002624 [Clydaea vesicula]